MILAAAGTLASYAIGWLIGVPALVPFLNAALPWWLMVKSLRVGQVRRAIAIMLVWALTMGVAATAMAALGWSRTRNGGDLFLRSEYRDQMIEWVRTGVGPESEPRTFLPRHLAYAGVFSVTALATGGALAMPMGAVLMNQMGEYVGAMTARSAHPLTSAVLGWHPWAVVRVTGFVMIGVVLSGVLLSRLIGFPYSLARQRRWLLLAVGLIGLDIALKWILAPSWGAILKGLAGW
jgi:hypothetical protein